MGPEIVGAVLRAEAVISEGRRVTRLIEDIQGEYWRGLRRDSIEDRESSTLEGAFSNLALYQELHGELEGLVLLSGRGIGLGNTGRLSRIRRSRQVEIGALGRETGLRLSGKGVDGFHMPFIEEVADLDTLREQDPNAFKHFAGLDHLSILGIIQRFAQGQARRQDFPLHRSS